tara:strand:- start:1358 stop:2224 length:867 start_codon:yes stop_codon:yes gene_type:complete
MNDASYQNLLANLRNSTQVIDQPPPVIEDEVNYMKETVKSSLEGMSGMLAAESLTSTVKKIRKGKKALSKASGASEAEVESAADDLENATDIPSAISSVVRMGINRAVGAAKQAAPPTKNIEDIVNEGGDEFNKITDDLGSPFSKGYSDPFTNAETTSGDYPRITDGPKMNDAGLPDMALTQEAETDIAGQKAESEIQAANEAGDVDKSAESALKLIKGEKVLQDINDATKASAVADEDPLGILLTGALGLAGTIGGLFIKTHKTENIIPKAIPPAYQQTYSAQEGVM